MYLYSLLFGIPWLPYCLGRFRPSQVNQMVGKVLKETLADKHYSAEEAKQWSREISETLQANLKGKSVRVWLHETR